MKRIPVDAVILCGGLGKRLRSVIGESPKPMAEVRQEPFLNILLKDLRKQGFQRIILCAGYKGEVIRDYYRKHDLGLSIEVSLEKSPLGTGGAIKYARPLITSPTFVVLNGDTFGAIDYAKFLAFHREKKAVASIVVAKTADRKDYGSILLNSSKKIVGFAEKVNAPGAGTAYVNGGIYCFDQKIFSLFPGQDVFSLEHDVFPGLVKSPFYGFETKKKFIDIGTPERYRSAEEYLPKK